MKSAVNLEVKTGNHETIKEVKGAAVSTFRQDTSCALSCPGTVSVTGTLPLLFAEILNSDFQGVLLLRTM